MNSPTLEGVLEYWRKPYFSLYIPLTYTVWSWLSLLSGEGGPQAEVFHSFNLICHLFNAALVFILLRFLMGKYSLSRGSRNPDRDLGALAGALVFAWHPLQTETVSWISGMKDCLFTFFTLCSMLQYLLHLNSSLGTSKKNPLHYFMALLFYLLSLLTKPSAVVVPVLLVLLERVFFGSPMVKCVLRLKLWFGFAIPLIVFTKSLQPDSLAEFSSIGLRPLIALDALVFSLFKCFFPLKLGLDYGRSPQWVLEKGYIYFSLIIALWAIWILKRPFKEHSWLRVSLLFFILSSVPFLGLIPFNFQNFSTVCDRYLYLPLIGFSIGTSLFLSEKGKVFFLVTATLLFTLASRTWTQVGVWRDSVSVFQNAIQVNPNGFLAHNNLGATLVREGRNSQALRHFERALQLKPSRTELHINMGVALAKLGRLEEGMEHFKFVLKHQPENPFAKHNIGLAKLKMGKGYRQSSTVP